MIQLHDRSTGTSLRIGVWNLKLAPNVNWPRGQQMLALAQKCNADIWPTIMALVHPVPAIMLELLGPALWCSMSGVRKVR